MHIFELVCSEIMDTELRFFLSGSVNKKLGGNDNIQSTRILLFLSSSFEVISTSFSGDNVMAVQV